MKVFLGVEFTFGETRLFLSQKEYIKYVLKRFEMEDCKPVSTPMLPTTEKSTRKHDSHAQNSKFPYKEAIGALLYLSTRTRPDTAQAVSMLARHSADPTSENWRDVKRKFRYLKGTESYGLQFRKGDLMLPEEVAFSDADWAGDKANRKSTSGFVVKVNGNSVAWMSKKQSSTALYSTEAEQIALGECGKEVR